MLTYADVCGRMQVNDKLQREQVQREQDEELRKMVLSLLALLVQKYKY
jgi:hypothetical protein